MTKERFSNLTVLNSHKERTAKFVLTPPSSTSLRGGHRSPLFKNYSTGPEESDADGSKVHCTWLTPPLHVTRLMCRCLALDTIIQKSSRYFRDFPGKPDLVPCANELFWVFVDQFVKRERGGGPGGRFKKHTCGSLHVLALSFIKTRGDFHMKGAGMLVVSLGGVNFRFWSRLGCSGRNTIVFNRKGLY